MKARHVRGSLHTTFRMAPKQWKLPGCHQVVELGVDDPVYGL